MNLNNPDKKQPGPLTDKIESRNLTRQEETEEKPSKDHSATTLDIPSFGWSAYAERINGRFAMIGFLAVLLIEALSNESFLHWAGFLMPK